MKMKAKISLLWVGLTATATLVDYWFLPKPFEPANSFILSTVVIGVLFSKELFKDK